MITGADAIRDVIDRVGHISLKDRHSRIGDDPLTIVGIVISILGYVAGVGDKYKILSSLIVGHPGGHCIEIYIPAGVNRIVLRVWDADYGEILSGGTGFLASIK